MNEMKVSRRSVGVRDIVSRGRSLIECRNSLLGLRVLRGSIGELIALMRVLRMRIKGLLVIHLGRHARARDPHGWHRSIEATVVGVSLVSPNEALVVVEYLLFPASSTPFAVEIVPLATVAEQSLLFLLDASLDEEDDDNRHNDSKGNANNDKCRCGHARSLLDRG